LRGRGVPLRYKDSSTSHRYEKSSPRFFHKRKKEGAGSFEKKRSHERISNFEGLYGTRGIEHPLHPREWKALSTSGKEMIASHPRGRTLAARGKKNDTSFQERQCQRTFDGEDLERIPIRVGAIRGKKKEPLLCKEKEGFHKGMNYHEPIANKHPEEKGERGRGVAGNGGKEDAPRTIGNSGILTEKKKRDATPLTPKEKKKEVVTEKSN